MDVKIVHGNIAYASVDVIVNAANKMLQMGSGVCGAIFEAAGVEKLQNECNYFGYCKTGNAIITSGCNLKARYIIHAVGPIYKSDKDAIKLKNAYVNSLKLADSHKAKSIAFPLISAGIYGYPLEKACKIALDTIKEYQPIYLKDCYIYCIDQTAIDCLNFLLKTE